MKELSGDFKERDIHVRSLSLICGIRHAGKGVDMRREGRSNSGILYIRRGKVRFSPVGEQELTAEAGDTVLIPKGAHYVMRYTEEGSAFALVNFRLCSEEGEEVSFFERISVLKSNDSRERIEEAF